MEKINKYSQYIIISILLLLMLRTCGIGFEISKINKNIDKLNTKVDSTTSLIITDSQMVKIIHTTPNWTTLEIEELSDKNKIPINFYKNKETIK